MNNLVLDEDVLRDYLLGNLSEAETERLDELSLTDDEFVHLVRVAENGVVDAYVDGELSGSLLQQFESKYLGSANRRQKVEFARSFREFIERNAETEISKAKIRTAADRTKQKARRIGVSRHVFSIPPLVGWSAAIASLILIVSIGWLGFDNLRLRRQIAQRQSVAKSQTQQNEQSTQTNRGSGTSAAEEELVSLRQTKERLEEELRKEKQRASEMERTLSQQQVAPAGAARLATFLLTPQMRSVGELRTISLPAGTATVVMKLQLEPNDNSRYRVVLLEGGKTIWRSKTIEAKGSADEKTLNVILPSQLFRKKTYVLRVYGIGTSGNSEVLSDYVFKIE